jgi:Cu(I)/Ag(I) efflux system membrane fusion protein
MSSLDCPNANRRTLVTGHRLPVTGHILLLFAVVLLAAGCGGFRDHGAAPKTSQKPAEQKYHCPMHPTYISDRPGSCPICGMDLVPVEDSISTGDAPSVSGRTTIFLTPERRRQIGLVTVPVERKPLARAIRATAAIGFDETRRVQVSPRVGGWIQELYADYEGRLVEKGQPLFTLYSPELLATQREYVNALGTGDAALIAAARRRLELWDISPDQITALERGAAPAESLTIRAPATGIVREKRAFRGMSFMPGEMLFEIADLSRVWVHASLFEQDLASVRTGQTARLAIEAFPNRLYSADVSFLSPTVDETSRRVEARLVADNADGELRPGMWGTVELDADLGEAPTVPLDALIDTGRRLVAFVDRDDGHLEPREVRVGARTDDFAQIRKGLSEGERVVTRALFLVDSESQLRAAIAGMAVPGE